MNKLKWFLLLSALAGLVLAAWGCAQTSIPNSTTAEENGIEYYLETDKSSYRLGESVSILFRVTNKTDEVRELGTVINCEYCMCQLQITLNDNGILPKSPFSKQHAIGRMDEVKAARELVLPKVLVAGRLY